MLLNAPAPYTTRDSELWISLPDGGRALGGSDDNFLKAAGFEIKDRFRRVDDYMLKDSPEFNNVNLRVWTRKGNDGLYDIDDGEMDIAIVGRDLLSEFNAVRAEAGKPKLREVLDFGMASCVLSLAIREEDSEKLSCLADFNNAVIYTSYVEATREMLGRQGVQADVRYRRGKLESKLRQSPETMAIADIIESGQSLVANGEMPFGMSQSDWRQVKNSQARLVDMPMSKLARLPGFIKASSLLMVRTAETLPAQKEAAIVKLAQRFALGAKKTGKRPRLKIKLPQPVVAARPSMVDGYGPHGWAHTL